MNFFEFDQEDFINKEDRSEITVYKKNVEQYITGKEPNMAPNERPRLKIIVVQQSGNESILRSKKVEYRGILMTITTTAGK
jgi:hypothetical protein